MDFYYKGRPAKPAEYADLKKELERMGYKLRIIHRIPTGSIAWVKNNPRSRRASPKIEEGEGYYYINGKFFDRISSDKSTIDKVCRKFNLKLIKVTPYKDSMTGYSARIDLARIPAKLKSGMSNMRNPEAQRDIFFGESLTAEKHGYGSMPHRWVSGLTKAEHAAVKRGEIVWFRIPKTHYTQSGYKVVTYYYGKWDSREPTSSELRIITKRNPEVSNTKVTIPHYRYYHLKGRKVDRYFWTTKTVTHKGRQRYVTGILRYIKNLNMLQLARKVEYYAKRKDAKARAYLNYVLAK